MIDFSNAEWEEYTKCYKLIGVENILAYIVPHLDENYEYIGFDYHFWIYGIQNGIKVSKISVGSPRFYNTFDECEQAFYDKVTKVVETI